MDNLTHSLVGAALARSGLDRTTPLATATLVLAANAPDVDVLAFTQGEWFALASRRGITHGVPAMLVWPFVLGAAMAGWDRFVRRSRFGDPAAPPARFPALLLLAFVGVLTHPVLDWMNTYGMRWWLPFDGSWSYGDALFIVDPYVWLMLGGAAVLGVALTAPAAAGWALLGALTSLPIFVSGRVGTIGQMIWIGGVLAIALGAWLGRAAPAGRRLALARALTGAAAVYVLAMIGLSRAAEGQVRAEIASAGIQGVMDVMIQPLPADPLASEVLIQTFDRYYQGSHDWRRSPRVQLVDRPALPRMGGDEPTEAVRTARELPDVRYYLTWSRYPYWFVERERESGPARVQVGDARYVERTGGLSGLVVTLP